MWRRTNVRSYSSQPTIDKNFLRRTKETPSREQITTIETITNGTLLHKVGITELLNFGITRVIISIAAFYKGIYIEMKCITD